MPANLAQGLDQYRTWPGEFIGREKYTERLVITDKVQGVYVPQLRPVTGISRATSAYLILTKTGNGELVIEVSREVYDLLEVGDPIVVRYQVARWTKGALKGEIAR